MATSIKAIFLLGSAMIKTDKGRKLGECLMSEQRLLKYYGPTICVLKPAQVDARRKQLKFRKLISVDGVEGEEKGKLDGLEQLIFSPIMRT